MSYERDNIARMQGYSYGEQPESLQVVKLNTNENPYPPSPAVASALTAFDPTRLRVYPNAQATPLRGALAELHGVQPQNLMITNGGDEALRLALTTFVDAGAVFASLTPSYSLYPVLAQIQDAKQLNIPLNPDFSLPQDLAGQLNHAHARLTCLVNPHAPSGTLIAAKEIIELAQNVEGVLLVDEAYVDFVDPSRNYDLTDALQELPNLVLLRSFSKGYSLAGLRCGYLMGHAGLIKPMMEKTRDSYNVDAITQSLALAAVTDQDYARDNWRTVCDSRAELSSQLTELGFRIPPSQGNFLLAQDQPAHALNAAELYQALRDQHLYVRYFAELPDRLRITIGTPDENRQLVAALRMLLG